jgi:hypothetical protein
MDDIPVAHPVKGYALWTSTPINVCAVSGLCRGFMIVWTLRLFIVNLRAMGCSEIQKKLKVLKQCWKLLYGFKRTRVREETGLLLEERGNISCAISGSSM